MRDTAIPPTRFSEGRTMLLRCGNLDPPMSQLGRYCCKSTRDFRRTVIPSLETSAAEACHDRLADGRSAPTVLSIQPRTAHSGEPSPAPDQSDCNAGVG